MSKLDEKLRASIKATRGKPAIPTKAAPTKTTPAKAVATKPAAKPAAKPDAQPKAEEMPTQAPARASSATKVSKPSALFPERVWPD